MPAAYEITRNRRDIYGPMSFGQLAALVDCGRLRSGDWVRRQGERRWQRAKDVAGLFDSVNGNPGGRGLWILLLMLLGVPVVVFAVLLVATLANGGQGADAEPERPAPAQVVDAGKIPVQEKIVDNFLAKPTWKRQTNEGFTVEVPGQINSRLIDLKSASYSVSFVDSDLVLTNGTQPLPAADPEFRMSQYYQRSQPPLITTYYKKVTVDEKVGREYDYRLVNGRNVVSRFYRTEHRIYFQSAMGSNLKDAEDIIERFFDSLKMTDAQPGELKCENRLDRPYWHEQNYGSYTVEFPGDPVVEVRSIPDRHKPGARASHSYNLVSFIDSNIALMAYTLRVPDDAPRVHRGIGADPVLMAYTLRVPDDAPPSLKQFYKSFHARLPTTHPGSPGPVIEDSSVLTADGKFGWQNFYQRKTEEEPRRGEDGIWCRMVRMEKEVIIVAAVGDHLHGSEKLINRFFDSLRIKGEQPVFVAD